MRCLNSLPVIAGLGIAAAFGVLARQAQVRAAPPGGLVAEAAVAAADVTEGSIAQGSILVITGQGAASFPSGVCFGQVEVDAVMAVAIDPNGGGAEHVVVYFAPDSIAPRSPGTRYVVSSVDEDCNDLIDLTFLTIEEK